MRRVGPALALFFLAPLIAEFLLGDFGINSLFALLFLAPMYGGGAILIRELTRRSGRGWPTMMVLALAYGIVEEGLVTQSLFNKNYAGLHLLDRWFVPVLGISVPWTLTVLAVHTIWSISVPIALVEGLTPARRTTPWLRGPGLVVAAVLAVLGALLNLAGSYNNDPFVAPWPRLAAVAVVAVVLTVLAFRLPRAGARPVEGRMPSPWLVLAVTLVAGALFRLPDAVPTWLVVGLMVVVFTGMTVAVRHWSARDGWGAGHRLALAAGATLTYAWHSFFMRPFLGDGPVITPVSHVVFAALALVLLYFEVRSLRAGMAAAGGTSETSETSDVTEAPGTAHPGEAFADLRSR
jgi:hypothetical protein